MAVVIPFEARRFKSAAVHYLAGRPPYPRQLITDVALLCGLTTHDRVLDLGCGPGQLSVAFSSLARDVLAIDPEPEMLALCKKQIEAANLRNVIIEQGSSNDFDESRGRFKLVVIGRAFHWMDREATLRKLDAMIDDHGAVVLFGDSHPTSPINSWLQEFDAVTDAYAVADPGRSLRKSPDWQGNDEVLLSSRFNQLERLSVFTQYDLSLDHVIDRALSRSSTSQQRLGDRADAMIADLRQRLTPLSSSGQLTELIEAIALIARRSVNV